MGGAFEWHSLVLEQYALLGNTVFQHPPLLYSHNIWVSAPYLIYAKTGWH